MTGLRRVLCSTGFCACLLSACGTGADDTPPLVSEVTRQDPRADGHYARAKAADASGDTNKAIKLYRDTAEKFPYSEAAPQARFRQGVLLEHQGELLDAFDAYQEVIQRYQNTGLYTEARTKQAVVAHAAAEGLIKNNFLGIKSRLDSKKIVEMLETVRDNAPHAASAPKAQFTIGEVLENRKKDDEAIAAFQGVVDDYATSSYAPEAQYHIGHILLAAAERGNQNQANLDKARHAFEDLILSYPNSARASDAKRRIADIGSRDIQRSYDIAEFYKKKGENTSAAFYYAEVVRQTDGGELHDRAQRRLQELEGNQN